MRRPHQPPLRRRFHFKALATSACQHSRCTTASPCPSTVPSRSMRCAAVKYLAIVGCPPAARPPARPRVLDRTTPTTVRRRPPVAAGSGRPRDAGVSRLGHAKEFEECAVLRHLLYVRWAIPTNPLTRRPAGPPTRRPPDPPTRRPADPPTRRPADPRTFRPPDPPTRQPTTQTRRPTTNPTPPLPG